MTCLVRKQPPIVIPVGFSSTLLLEASNPNPNPNALEANCVTAQRTPTPPPRGPVGLATCPICGHYCGIALGRGTKQRPTRQHFSTGGARKVPEASREFLVPNDAVHLADRLLATCQGPTTKDVLRRPPSAAGMDTGRIGDRRLLL